MAKPEIVDAINTLECHGTPPAYLAGLRSWSTGQPVDDKHVITMYSVENPIEKPKGNFPPEGKFFPLAKGAKLKADWNKFFVMLSWLKMIMVSLGVKETVGGDATRSPEAVVQDVLNNLYTLVLSTVYCAGWSITWAMSAAMLIVQSYQDCEHLMLIAVEGGPGCEEECSFLDILLRCLGFAMTENADRQQNYIEWIWQIERQGAMPFSVSLRKMFNPVVEAQYFKIMEISSAVPNLFRTAVVSCAEKWGPQKAETLYVPELHPRLGYRMVKTLESGGFMIDDSEDPNRLTNSTPGVLFRTKMQSAATHPHGKTALFGQVFKGKLVDGWLKGIFDKKDSRRRNDNGDSVNDVLNSSIVAALEKVKNIYGTRKCFPPVKYRYEDIDAYENFW